jgi:hypothetical protein
MEKIDYKDELYKASLIAFFKNEADNDKLILGLSVAGIGFIISIVRGESIVFSCNLLSVTMFISLFCFLITILSIVLIFYYNKKQLLNIISSKGDADEDPTLSTLDKVKYIPFLIAVAASVTFVFTLIFQ